MTNHPQSVHNLPSGLISQSLAISDHLFQCHLTVQTVLNDLNAYQLPYIHWDKISNSRMGGSWLVGRKQQLLAVTSILIVTGMTCHDHDDDNDDNDAMIPGR